MRNLCLALCTLTLVACTNSPEETGGAIKEFITDSAPDADSSSSSGITPALQDSLSDYYSPTILSQLISYLSGYNNLTSPEQFEQNYRTGLALFDSMYLDLNNPTAPYLAEKSKTYEYWSAIEVLDELRLFNKRLGPIDIECVAECTDIAFLFNLTHLREKAKVTEGKGDDDFFELVIAMEGDYGYASYPGPKTWFTLTWDLGGRINIGNDVLYNCIILCQDFKQNHPTLFMEEIKAIHEDFADALIYGNIYSFDQITILKEYDKILKLNFFTAEENKKIKEHYQDIKAGGDDYQFECETNDCVYG